MAKFKAAPGSKTPSENTGAKLLFQLGYGNADTCVCCACLHGQPVANVITMVQAPTFTIPHHPSYVKKTLELSQIGTSPLIDRIKGFCMEHFLDQLSEHAH